MIARVSILLKSRVSLTYFRASFLPGRAKDLSAPRYSDQATDWISEELFRLSAIAGDFSFLRSVQTDCAAKQPVIQQALELLPQT